MLGSRVISVDLGAGVTGQILGASGSRAGIMFFPASIAYSVAPEGVTPSATAGWTIQPGSAPVYIQGPDAMVRSRWVGFSAAGSSIMVCETLEGGV